jgi:TRAP-type uncharacterized transport system substrate-binding protein
MPRPARQNATAIRSCLVLEIASELVAAADQPLRQAKVLLREQGAESRDWPLCLFSSSTVEGIEAVVNSEAALGMVNPSAVLTLAYRGTGPFKSPQPVRALGVIPSPDQYLFAVNESTGLRTFEDIAARRYPLRIAMRGQADHCLHLMFEHIAAAAGFSCDDLRTWGGGIRREGGVPNPKSPQFRALARGEVDAIFDESADTWLDEAIDSGMTILSLSEATVQKLEAMGYRRAVIAQRQFPRLARDILTIDFSGWPVFVHAELPDRLVTQLCEALDARKEVLAWQGEGPLPVERMAVDAPDTPRDVPLHPAAERFWKARGYLP